ncbi:hypothetical protein, partial [Bordetella pertussis]|uniref:hypothetical protein n=1 Tax=Bordetella pertussis TaxID=520 RepID=UPI0012B180F1
RAAAGPGGPDVPATPPGLPQPLYETRLSYLDQSHYYGSQYFFDLIRYRPDRPLRTIGDNYFETRLIREQIARAMGGHEYRNAVRGLALVVRETVDGQEVLVPRVYLTRATRTAASATR